ncbi:SRPBCC family protein [Kallotenue papyrolyticum]|uniref:SRPBCC family protein n=1 Tax=Kallotenue papyrolyticum TaxID=1325125 RepID=UPI00047854A0|nr:SRPBCC family protein [Kallotenue papyrolyticum]
MANHMLTVERKRLMGAPAQRVQALLNELERLPRWLPRLERVEVLSRTEQRARLALLVRLGRLGRQRVEGEARLLEHGLRFIAVEPAELDIRWLVLPRGEASEVQAQVALRLPPRFGALARFMPQRLIVDRIGAELDAGLEALAAQLSTQREEPFRSGET